MALSNPALVEKDIIERTDSTFLKTDNGGGGYHILSIYGAIDLARELDSALARARDIALARARDIDRARDRARARDIDHALAHAIALVSARARDIAHAIAIDSLLAIDSAHARDIAHDLDRAIDLAFDLETDRAIASALDSVVASAIDSAIDIAIGLDFNIDIAIALARELDSALALARARDLDSVIAIDTENQWCNLIAFIITAKLLSKILTTGLEGRRIEAYRMSLVTSYFFALVCHSFKWLGDVDELTFNRYIETLEALHTATFGKQPLSDEDANKGILLIREYVLSKE